MRSPFKFLDAFTLNDKEVFFGREEEVAALYDMVLQNRLILVYGQSGTGKTSLVQCGLASRFDATDWYPIFIRRGEDINHALEEALQKAAGVSDLANAQEYVEEIYATYLRPVYLLFDQLEELFILADPKEQSRFINTINELLEARLPCRIIFIMREEYIAHLYGFEKVIPILFDRRLRVEPMTFSNVEKVILRSCEKFNIRFEKPELNTRQIIENISSGKSGIPLPYLQVYLDTLYREDYRRTYPEGSAESLPRLEFTQREIEEFGEIGNVLQKFMQRQQQVLQKSLPERFPNFPADGVFKLLDAFVTDEGTKRPVHYQMVGENIVLETQVQQNLGDLPAEALTSCLQGLEQSRILRVSEKTFELAHDSLAAIIDRERSDEQRKLNEVRTRIANSYREWKETGEFLSRKQLLSIEEYLPRLPLEGHLEQFVQDSEREVTRRENVEKERQQQELARERELRGNAEKNEKIARKNAIRAKRTAVWAVITSIGALLLALWALNLSSRTHLATGENYLRDEAFDEAVKEFTAARRFSFFDRPFIEAKITEVDAMRTATNEYRALLAEGDSLLNIGPVFYMEAREKYNAAANLRMLNSLQRQSARSKGFDLEREIDRAFEQYKERGKAFYNASGKRGRQDARWAFQIAEKLRPGDPFVLEKLEELNGG